MNFLLLVVAAFGYCHRRQSKARVSYMVEAAGVELFNVLILRKLLVSLEARSAKNASLPGRRYKNGTNFGM